MNDRSLQILACPDAGREVEELRELILDMAHEKTINSFADIAVYMPDTSKYLPHIQRVFGAYPLHHPEHIPFSILGASCGSSLVARGLFALLGIVSGEFNRARVFELLRNPIVQASRKISPSSVEVWERMAETFGIFRGYDAEQRRSMGDVGEAVTDEHTFTRGIARINEEADVAGSGVILRDNKLSAVFRPDTAASVAKVSAERFLSLLTELNDLSKQFTKSIHTSANVEGGLGRSSLQNINKSCIISIRESIEAIRKAVWSWLGVITEDVGDSIAEARVRREALEGIELIKLQSTLAGREGMERDEFIALVRGCVPEELEVPSSAWHGITFAPLRSSMVLPHRAIFVLGLDATAFPGTSEPGGWNLLSRNRIVGDSDKVRDNRFAFLELLHAAKERLVLSFRARDMQKDELLQPSSVVLELEEYLKNQRIINKDSNDKNFGECLVRREIPWVVHESLDAAKKYGRGHGTWDKAQRELADIAAESAGKRAEHRHKLAPPSTKRAPLTTDEDGGATNLYDLKKFFENPIEYHLARTLGIRGDDDTGDMMAADEPVSTEKIFSSKLRRQVWITVLNLIFSDDCTDTDSLVTEAVDEADRIYDEHIDSGQAPEGHIRRMEKRELLEWTKKCVEAANALRGHFPYHTLTEKSEFSFTCSGFTVTGEFALTLVPKNPNDKSQKTGILAFDKYDAPGDSPGLWLDGMALWRHQAQNGDPRPIALVALNHGDTPEAKLSTMKMNWENGQLDEIEKWLAGLLTQMLTNNACEHLPFRVIADIIKPKKKDGEVGFEERMKKLTTQALKDNLLGDKYSTFTEAFDLTDATPPELDDAALQKLLESRYAPILGRWIHE